jgi:hypothetical protein
MAAEFDHEAGRLSPQAAAAPPLAPTTTESMEVDSDNEATDDVQHDIELFRTRKKASRTLYRQNRADDDTV